MSDIDKKLDDVLLHYGVKGMKWDKSKLTDSQLESEGASTKEQLDELGDKISDIKGKVGDGPLDMLRYVITGKKKEPVSSTNTTSAGDLGTKIKDLKSKVGNNPIDLLRYVVTGKRTNGGNSINLDALGKKLKDVKRKIGTGTVDMLRSIFTGKTKIKHSGVMGMKWGVRRNRNQPGGADGKADAKDKPIRTALGKRWNSLKRERQWNQVLREMDNLSTKDITEVAKRVSLENSLKSLSRSNVGTKKDKEDYLRRDRMDNAELSRKVMRLRAKDSLRNAVKSASKEQRELGQKIVQIGSSLGSKYALNRLHKTGGLGFDDVFESLTNPKGSADKAKGDLKTELTKRGRAYLKNAVES